MTRRGNHDHAIAAVAIDTIPFEPVDAETADWQFPVQMIMLRDTGMLLGRVWDLDQLAADCEDDGGYGCLLSANPLPLTGAVGGVCAPVAMK